MCFKESRRLFFFLCECYVLGHYRRYNYNCSSIFDAYILIESLLLIVPYHIYGITLLIMLLSQFPLTFHHIHNRMPHFMALPMTILVLIGMVFVIMWEVFHGRIPLDSVLLLLLVNFLSGFRLELMYISLIERIRSSLTHLHGFQLLVLLS